MIMKLDDVKTLKFDNWNDIFDRFRKHVYKYILNNDRKIKITQIMI